jgi:hypothetical protein
MQNLSHSPFPHLPLSLSRTRPRFPSAPLADVQSNAGRIHRLHALSELHLGPLHRIPTRAAAPLLQWWIGSASLQAELSPWNQIGSRRKLSNIESIMAGMGHSEVGLCWWPLRASIFHLRAPTQPEGKVPFSMSFLCLSLFLLYLSAYCVLGCLHWSEMNDSQSFKYLVSVGIDDGAILFGLLTRRLSIYRSELFNGLFHGAVLYHWP